MLEKREHILARLKARFRTVPDGVSLVDELIEERRRGSSGTRTTWVDYK